MEDVDDDTPMVHVSKQMKVGIDGDGISIGNPNKIDDLAKSMTEDPLGRLEMKRRLVTVGLSTTRETNDCNRWQCCANR